MKKVVLLVVLLIPLFVLGNKRVNIGEALSSGMISCNIHKAKNAPDSLKAVRGITMSMDLENLGNSELDIVLESGRRFISLDSSFQNLLVTRERIIHLNPAEKMDYAVVSYCTNASRLGPSYNTYKLGGMAKGLLLKMANFLGFHNITSKAAQDAVWVLTDKHNIQAVNGTTRQETRLIRNYLYEITRTPRPPRYLDPLSYPAVSIQGQIDWEMPRAERVFIYVYDKAGKQLSTLVSDRNYNQGKQLYTFHFLDDALIPGEDYRVKVTAGETVLNEITVKGNEQKLNFRS